MTQGALTLACLQLCLSGLVFYFTTFYLFLLPWSSWGVVFFKHEGCLCSSLDFFEPICLQQHGDGNKAASRITYSQKLLLALCPPAAGDDFLHIPCPLKRSTAITTIEVTEVRTSEFFLRCIPKNYFLVVIAKILQCQENSLLLR